MSYLGRGLEQVDNISKLDNITFNGGTTYALTKDSSAFTPISSNALLVSIDGVIQQGNFSVSGTNIVFNFSPTGSNTCDFIMHYGTGVAFTPADSSITKDKTNFVSTSSAAGLEIKGDNTTDGTLQLNCRVNSHGIKLASPPHSAGQSYTLTFPSTAPASNKIMQTDGSGNLSFVDAPSGGLVYVGGGSTTSDVTNITIDNVFTSTYKNYLIVGEYTPDNSSGANARFKFRTGGSSGSDLSGTEYNYHFIRMNADSSSLNNIRDLSGTYCEFSAPVKDDVIRVGVRFSWTVFDPFTTSRRTTVSGTGKMTATDGNSAFISGSCDYKGSESVTGIKFYFSADNVANADINVYGIVDS